MLKFILIFSLTIGNNTPPIVTDCRLTNEVRGPTWRQVIKAQRNTIARTKHNLEVQENRNGR